MRHPDPIKDKASGAAGYVGEAAIDRGIDGKNGNAQGATVIVFLASYSIEEFRQHHAAHGHRVREMAARLALAVLRLIWRVLP
jgi:hypothetical protein